jgi:hypothetical protein
MQWFRHLGSGTSGEDEELNESGRKAGDNRRQPLQQ